MDLDHLIVTVFCQIDDALTDMTTCSVNPYPKQRQRGPKPSLADREVLTIEILGAFLGLYQDKQIFLYFRQHCIIVTSFRLSDICTGRPLPGKRPICGRQKSVSGIVSPREYRTTRTCPSLIVFPCPFVASPVRRAAGAFVAVKRLPRLVGIRLPDKRSSVFVFTSVWHGLVFSPRSVLLQATYRKPQSLRSFLRDLLAPFGETGTIGLPTSKPS